MMGSTRGLALAVAVIALAVALPGAPAAAGGTLISLKVAKREQGPYRGFVNVKIDSKKAKNLYWRAKNRTGERLTDMVLHDADTTYSGYRVRWFKGKRRITDKVRGDGYVFNLKAGKAKTFRSRVKAPAKNDPLCLTTGLDTSLGLLRTTASVNGAVCGL